MPVTLTLNLDPDMQSGLAVVARCYAGEFDAVTVTMAEVPDGSARYAAATSALAPSTAYTITFVNGSGAAVGYGAVRVDAAGNDVDAIDALDAAGVRAALGLSIANLDTQLSGLSLKGDAAIEAADAATQAAMDAEAATADGFDEMFAMTVGTGIDRKYRTTALMNGPIDGGAFTSADRELLEAAAQGSNGEESPMLLQILDMLRSDPPTQTGQQQHRARKIVRGDTYGPTARRLIVERHRSAAWPLDLAEWAWAFTAAKEAGNDGEGGTFAGTVDTLTATGDARALEISITSDTAAAALGRHRYAVVGSRDGAKWTVELGVMDVTDSPAVAPA